MTEENKNTDYEKDSDYESMFGSGSDDDENQNVRETIQQQTNEDTKLSSESQTNKHHPIIIDLVEPEKGNTSAAETFSQGFQKKGYSRLENKKNDVPLIINLTEEDTVSLTEMTIPRKRRKHLIDTEKQKNIDNLVNIKVRHKIRKKKTKSVVTNKEAVDDKLNVSTDKEDIIKRARARIAARQAPGSISTSIHQSKFKPQTSKSKLSSNWKYDISQFSTIVDIDYFWKSLRNWNYIDDLIKSIRSQIHTKSNENNICPETLGHQMTDSIAPESDRSKQPIPNTFQSPKQYKSIWAPLLMEETKSQMLSEICPLASRLPQMLISVQATPTRLSDENSDVVTLNISVQTSKEKECTLIMTEKPSSKILGHNRTEFVTNDLVLLVPDIDLFQAACEGSHFFAKPVSLLSYTSPLIKDRFGAIGIVMNRTKNVEGLLVSVSRKLWKRVEPSRIYLLRLNDSITGKWKDAGFSTAIF